MSNQLPDLWRLTKIEVLCQPIDRVNPRNQGEGDFHYIDISSIDNDLKTITDVRRLPNKEAPSRARQQVATNDVLVSTIRPNLNAVALVPEELDKTICSTGFCVLRPKQSIVEPEYLFAWVRHPEFIQRLMRLARGASYPAVTDSDILGLRIPLPPLFEQRRIVKILRQADALRQQQQAALEKAQQLIPAIFYEMFGDPATNPKGWPQKPLGKIIEINPRIKEEEIPDDKKIVSFVPMSIVDQDFGTLDPSEKREYGEVSKGYTFFREGDVLFAKITPSMQNGKSAIAKNLSNGIGFGSTEFHVLRPNNLMMAEYLLAFVRRFQFRELATRAFVGTAGQQRVPDNFLRRSLCPLPPPELQIKFSARVSKVQKLHADLLKSLKDIESLFNSSLNQAFNGELTEQFRANKLELLTQEALERDTLIKTHRQTKPAPSKEIPVSALHPRAELVRALSGEDERHPGQRGFLELLQDLEEPYFTTQMLVDDPNIPYPDNFVAKTLELFERVGLIVRVRLPVAPTGRESAYYETYYRLPDPVKDHGEEVAV